MQGVLKPAKTLAIFVKFAHFSHLLYSKVVFVSSFTTCKYFFVYTHTHAHSIMGEGGEVGVVPQFCRELFDRVSGSAGKKASTILPRMSSLL